MKVVFLGSSGPLSFIPLRALIAAQCEIAAVGIGSEETVQETHAVIPVVTELRESIQTLAVLHDIPVVRFSSNVLQQLQSYSPDVILVSCFAQKLSDSILELPPLGCFNLHPSLLPKYRGPVPLYWQLQDGIQTSGVTLHRMSSDLDAGPIVGQEKGHIQKGDSQHSVATRMAELGAQLMLDCLENLKNGTLKERIQDESEASYQGYA